MSNTIDLSKCTAAELIQVWLDEKAARLNTQELEEVRRLDKVLPLVSITEGANLCPGFGEECGDELDEGQEICASCERAETQYYDRKAWAEDGHEEFVAYPHLTDRGAF